MLTAILFGATWVSSAQGILGYGLGLQLRQALANGGTHRESGAATVDDPAGVSTTIGRIAVDIGDAAVDLGGDVNVSTDLSIVDINDLLEPISDATGTDSGNVSYGKNGDGHQYLTIGDLNGGIQTQVDVTLDPPTTIPEPGGCDLMALGLMVMGMSVYLCRQPAVA